MSTAMIKNTIYLNFGDNWRTDFTIEIPSNAKRRFSKAGLDPLQWGNTRVRVRGWIDSYNGPIVKVEHPEAIQILSESSSP